MKNVYAYTEPGVSYPGYISVNRLDEPDTISVSVRDSGEQYASVLKLTHDQARAMAQAILQEVGHG